MGFNGAARFCVRKWGIDGILSRLYHASMGPHVFACGNVVVIVAERLPAKLQWGRTFLRAEIILVMAMGSGPPLLQWGRTFLRAEIDGHGSRRRPVSELQWGRTFLRAEISIPHPTA